MSDAMYQRHKVRKDNSFFNGNGWIGLAVEAIRTNDSVGNPWITTLFHPSFLS